MYLSDRSEKNGKNDFIREIETCTNPKVKAESIMDNFVLTKKVLTTQVRKREPIIWVMGTNKYRHELRPFICLDNNRIVISYCALDQSINLWVSMFNNGGMCYTNAKDKLTTAIEKRNDELSKKLVDIHINV